MRKKLPPLYHRLLKLPVLSKETELDLARAAQAGDLRARQQLVEHNAAFAFRVVCAFKSHVDRNDLLQTALVAAARAAETYDQQHNTRFITYAAPFIRGAIADYHLRNLAVVPCTHTRHLRQAYFKLNRYHYEFQQLLPEEEQGRSPTVAECSVALGLPEKSLRAIFAAKECPDWHVDREPDLLQTPLADPEEVVTNSQRQEIHAQAWQTLEAVATKEELAVAKAFYVERKPQNAIAAAFNRCPSWPGKVLRRLWSRVRTKLGSRGGLRSPPIQAFTS